MLRQTSEVAEEWLAWCERWPLADNQHSLAYLVEQGAGLRSDNFEQHILARHRDMKSDDVRAVLGDFATQVEHAAVSGSILADLYSRVLKTRGIRITFDGGRPLVAGEPRCFEAWCRLIDFFDPDNFVALALADLAVTQGVDVQIDHVLDQWPLVLAFADPDIARLCERGLSDIHLHFKSLWPVPLSWQRVLRAEAGFEPRPVNREGMKLGKADSYKPYSKPGANSKQGLDEELLRVREGAQLLRRGGPGSRLAHLRSEERTFLTHDLSDAVSFDRRRTLHSDATVGGPDETHFIRKPLLPRRPRDILRAERMMLFDAWREILARSEGHCQTEVALDRYLLAKSMYRARQLQSFDQSNPGLHAFDSKRRHNSHLGRMAREETAGGGFSGARFRQNNGMLLATLFECEPLKRAELRIAPPAAPPIRLAQTYGRLMRASDSLLRDVSTASCHAVAADMSTKFAVHFKRAMGGQEVSDKRRGAPPSSSSLRKLMEYDLESAALQNFRFKATSGRFQAQQRGSHLRSQGDAGASRDSRSEQCHFDLGSASDLIGRLDLASPERGSGPWLVAPYIQLLRGDPEAIADLKNSADNPYFARWSALLARNQSVMAISAKRFGLTCHAGEDFYTLVDGLWHIDAAIDSWRLTAGDGIGHALALGQNAERFRRERLAGIRMPQGFELDALVWLLQLLERCGFPDNGVIRVLQSAVLEKATDCYGPKLLARNKSVTIDLLLSKLSRLDKPIPACSSLAVHRLPSEPPSEFIDSLDPGDQLRCLDYFDERIARWRAKLNVAHQVHERLDGAIEFAQCELRKKVRAKGIVIETNPSSNLRMERAGSIADLPIFTLLEDRDARVTVCTDNPGTYDTNVASEYSLLFAGYLQRNGEDHRDDVLSRLDELRRVGLEKVTW